MKLNINDKKELLRIARESIKGKFTKDKRPVPDYEKYPDLKIPAGAFVTLTQRGRLRGCIGYVIAEEPLFITVTEAARQAAFHDPRFKPLTEEELENVTLEVSVLLPPYDISGYDKIEPVIELVKEGNLLQFRNKAFVNELVSWIRFSRSSSEKHMDGLRSAVMGAPAVPDFIGRLFMKFLTGEKEAAKCEKAIRSSSALALFIAENDEKKDWINLGRSFQRFGLKAASLGIKLAHINMPCEEVSVREKLREHLGLSPGRQPLLLLRMGYAENAPYSYRRPVEEVIVTGI